ncbi:MAG: DUF2905 domain-containing protein [Deltaproteobacteria bacterium]|nr:MAG: DUF2905 domain-containing protein [Deltaproteobacteria bacterium]
MLATVDDLARFLLLVGAAFLALGGFLLLAQKMGLGRLPGDLVFERDGFSLHVPLATSLLLSVVLTVLLNLFVGRGGR